MAAVVRDLAEVNAELQEQKERVENVDFKMITFSLSGKDYGVDIMNVKEIAKADKFTYVPNAAGFVRGVYNLRGDIIPIIDLRLFFHLPVERKGADVLENMLILRIGDKVYGTIVDKIDKVVGINSDTIQPPHPIFGDINIKFISGVVEKEGDLYIILDVIRIFSQSEEDKNKPRGVADAGGEYYAPAASQADTERVAANNAQGFIKESLAALKQFTVSTVNDAWFRTRFAEWSISHTGAAQQLQSGSDADEFLDTFYSPSSGTFWDDDYANAVMKALPHITTPAINAWNIGCGKGYETFSFACILKAKYPGGKIKIWANDNDIMAISQAANLVFDMDEVPEHCRTFVTKGKAGYSFNQEIRDAIVFEYHDVSNENTIPDVDLILARDMLSFFTQAEQDRMIKEFVEKLKGHGLVILGRNEELSGPGWKKAANDPVSAYYNA